jgi:REP element-mobilizing transposase RayT
VAHTFTSIIIHAIFSTKNRDPILLPEIRERLFPYMGGMIRELKGTALLINGVEDHVHVLTSLPAMLSLSDFMRELKSVSSGWVNDHFAAGGTFGWQTGYAAFSVSKSAMEDVRAYIARQEERHRRVTFQEEYLKFLEKHGIEYDARFVFEGTYAG